MLDEDDDDFLADLDDYDLDGLDMDDDVFFGGGGAAI